MHRIHFTMRRIAPADLPTIRDSETRELRPATEQELLNMGIQHIADDLYSCVEQYRRDDELLIATGEVKWESHGPEVPGDLVVDGPDRYQRLPDSVRGKIMSATVIRSAIDGVTAVEIAAASLTEQETALAKYVGDVDGAPLIDLWTPEMGVAEAQRMVDVPDSGLERVTVRMGQVKISDVVEADMIEPHRWAGERRR